MVPIDNARYALNAANARWGSLFDALYGTDALPAADGCAANADGSYNEKRGEAVFAYAASVLDNAVPLENDTSHALVTAYAIKVADGGAATLHASVGDATVALKNAQQLVGYTGSSDAPASLLFVHNGLHLEVVSLFSFFFLSFIILIANFFFFFSFSSFFLLWACQHFNYFNFDI